MRERCEVIFLTSAEAREVVNVALTFTVDGTLIEA